MAPGQGATKQKGVLLLADIVDFTPQAEQLGSGPTRDFLQAFESNIKTTAEKYKGDYIKRSGDAVLLFFAEETDALDFSLRMREASRQRELDCKEFVCSLRIVAHFGKFAFQYHQERLPLKVSELYERYNRGVIFGLPGSGKTTILKYFAFRELQKNAMTLDPDKKRIVLFIQCRDIMSYGDWYRQHPGIEKGEETGLEYSIELILSYLVHSFLFTRQAPGAQAAIQAAEMTAQHAYYQGRLTLLIDALDEADHREIKEGVFNKDMKTFFQEARSLVVLEEKPYITAGKIYDALTLLAYGYIGKQKEITEEDLLDNFRLFAREEEKPGEEKKEAHRWMNRLKEDQLLVPTGLSRYVFIHATVMEYLAARYLVEKVNNPGYLMEKYPIKSIAKAVEKVDPVFYQTETLPIAVGSGIREGAHILKILEQQVPKVKDQDQQNRLHLTALKSLAEWESYIDRQYQRQHLEYLQLDREKQIEENWDAVDWVYRYLSGIILCKDKQKIKTAVREFKNISRLCRPYFLEKYLTYEAYWQGDSEMTALRKELLDGIIKAGQVDQWLSRHREKEEQVYREAVKEPVLEAVVGVLTLDSREYHPEDKNFQYYQEYSGKELIGFLGSPNLRHSGVVTCVDVSPDGKWIISGSDDKTLKLWDVESGKEVRTFKGHNSYVNSVAFIPQGNLILSGSIDKTMKLWDLHTGEEIRTFKGHSDTVRSVVFSPRGNVILSGSDDMTMKLWDLKTGKEILTFKGHNASVNCVAFSPEGNYILSGSDEHTLKLWDMETGQCLKTIPLLWMPREIKPAPHQPGLFATANANGTVTLFDFTQIIGKH
ncbi:MAG: hypothetical protein JSV88_23705 [Candidatus Aminicenantes bacterium]|nr:MAG: hypothetical protein JSV88_23705 [Candidatus Aminicenantes bacterium]